MANSRQFLEQSLIACGVVGFTARSKAFVTYITTLFSSNPKLLPEGWEFYEIGGQVLFPIYGRNGGLTTMNVCYLIQKAEKQNYAIAVTFNDMDMAASNVEHVCKLKLKEAIRNIKPVPVDLNGGALPMPEGFNG